MITARKSPRQERVRRWKAALASAGLTVAAWAERNGPQPSGWSDSHVSAVVSGKRESSHVLERVLAFINEQEDAVRRRPRHRVV